MTEKLHDLESDTDRTDWRKKLQVALLALGIAMPAGEAMAERTKVDLSGTIAAAKAGMDRAQMKETTALREIDAANELRQKLEAGISRAQAAHPNKTRAQIIADFKSQKPDWPWYLVEN